MIKREETIESFEPIRNYTISDIKINKTAIVFFDNNIANKALINLETGEIIGKIKNYNVNTLDNLFILIYKELDKYSINLREIKKVKIYNALNNKLLCDNWDLIMKKEDTYILKNVYTKKYHIISKNIEDFDKEYDDIEETSYLNLFIVSLNGKKALYKNGFISDFIFEGNIKINIENLNIDNENNYKIFNVNGIKALWNDINNEFLTNLEYNYIFFKGNILIFNKENENYLYYFSSNFNVNQMVHAKSNNIIFKNEMAIWKEDKYFRVFEYNKIITNIVADELYFEETNNILIYKKNNKYGLINTNYYNCILTNPIYLKITLLGKYYFAEKEKEQFDIFDMNGKNILNDISVIQDYGENILILKNKDNYLIFNVDGDNSLEKLKGIPRFVGNDYFIIKENDEENYQHLKIYIKEKKVLSVINYTNYNFIPQYGMIVLETADIINYELLKLNVPFNGPESKMIYDKTSIKGDYKTIFRSTNPIKLTDNFAIIQSQEELYLIALNDCNKIEIPKPYTFKMTKFNSKEFYFINGIWYTYDIKTSKLIEENEVPVTSYNASYETEYGTVIVNEFDKTTYDYKCKIIEESNVDLILEQHYKNNRVLQLNYPNLKK